MSLRRRLLQGVSPSAMTTRQMVLVGGSALMLGMAVAGPAPAAVVESFTSPLASSQTYSGSTSLHATGTGLLAGTVSTGGTLVNAGTLLAVGTVATPHLGLFGMRSTLVSGGTILNEGTIAVGGTISEIIQGILVGTGGVTNSVIENQGFIGGTLLGTVSAASSVRGITVQGSVSNSLIVNSGTILGGKVTGITIGSTSLSVSGSTILNSSTGLIGSDGQAPANTIVGIRVGNVASSLIENDGFIGEVGSGTEVVVGFTVTGNVDAGSTILNAGTVSAVNSPVAGAGIIVGTNDGWIENRGTIALSAAGATTGVVGISIAGTSTGTVLNDGLITLSSSGRAPVGISVGTLSSGSVINSGKIAVSLSAFSGTGISIGEASGGVVSNQGTILGMNSTAMAFHGIHVFDTLAGTILNQGVIIAGQQGSGISVSELVATGSIGNSSIISAGTTANAANIGIAVSDAISGTITNSGTISAGGVGISALNMSATTALIDNSGTITARTGILSTLVGGVINNSGTIAATALGVSAGTLIGVVGNQSGGVISVSGSGGVGISAGQVGTFSSGAILGTAGTIVNAGAILAPGGIGIGIGTLLAATSCPASGGLPCSSGVVVNSGRISAQTAISIGSGPLALTNSGTISGNISDAGSIFTVTGGSTAAPGTLTGGTISAAGMLFSSGAQMLGDDINVGGGTVVNSGAALSINAAHTITGAFTQSSGSLMIGVSGTGAGNYGELVVTGAASLANSTVTLTGQGGFALAAGETFTIVNAGTLLGNLSTDTFFAAGLVATGTIVGDDLEVVLSAAGGGGSAVTLGNLTSVYSNSGSVSGAIAVQASSIGAGGSIANSGTFNGTGANGIALQIGTMGGNGISNSAGGVILAASGIGVAIGNAAGGSLVNSGLISGRTALSIGSGALNLTNSGTVSGDVLGNGVLTVAGGTAGTPGRLTGGTIHASGLTFTSGAQVLADNINVGAGTVVNSGATLSINGTQSIAGAFAQSAGSLVIGVSGTGAGTYGELVVTGAASLVNSSVTLAALGGFSFATGETFTILDAASLGNLTGDTFFVGTAVATTTVVNGELEVIVAGAPLNTVSGTVLASPFTGTYTNNAYMAGGATGILANVVGNGGGAGTISNTGTIAGSVAGIGAASFRNGLIANSGLITVAAGAGSGAGISIAGIVSVTGGTVLASNAAGGTIAVTGVAGATGITIGTMAAGSVVNSGVISASLTSGSAGSLAGIAVGTLGGAAQILNAGTIQVAGGNSALSGPALLQEGSSNGQVVELPAPGAGVGIEAIFGSAGAIPAITNSGLIQAPIGILASQGLGDGVTVTNSASGTIAAGNGIGIVNYGTNAIVANQGVISAGTGIWLIDRGAVTNSGTIQGIQFGINSGNSNLTNSGFISASGASGVAAALGTGTLINNSGGSIVGATAAIAGLIVNSGVIAGDIVIGTPTSGPLGLDFAANSGTGVLTGSNGNPGLIGNAACATTSGCAVNFEQGSSQRLNDDINVGPGGFVNNSGTLTITNQRTVTAQTFIQVNNSGSGGGIGTIVVGVGGASSTNYGELVVKGGVELQAGTNIELEAENGFAFAKGELFTIATGSVFGNLASGGSVASGFDASLIDLSIVNGTGTASGDLTLVNGTELLVSITSASGGGSGSSGASVNIGTLTSVYNIPAGSLVSGVTAFQVTVLGSGGTISNAGTISGSVMGIAVGNASGGAIVNSGLISAATAISIGSGSLTVTNSGTISGVVTDAGGAIAFAGGTGATYGTLTGGGINAQGVTFVSGNQQLNENISVGTSGTVVNAATLALSGPQTVTGNFAQTASNGVLGIRVSGDQFNLGAYGELAVTGAATLAGGTVAMSAQTGFHFNTGETMTVLAASNLSGGLSNVSFTDGARTVTGAISESGGDMIVSITGVTSIVGTQLGNLTSAYTIGAGTTIAGGTGVLVSVVGSGGVVNNAGAILSTIAGGSGLSVATLAGGGAITNSGAINATSGIGIVVSTLSGDASVTNSGTIGGRTALYVGTGTGALNLVNSGTIGAITDNSSGNLTVYGGSASTPGSLTGPITAANMIIASGAQQQLTGNVTVGASRGSVINNGTLMLPIDPTVTGNFVQTASNAVLQISAPSTVAGSYGDLVVSGSATLTGGTIVLSAENSFTFASGEVFTIVTAGSSLTASGLSVSLSGAQLSGLTEGFEVVGGDELLVTIGGGVGLPISIASLTSALNIGSGSIISAATAVQVGVIGGGGALNNSGSLTGLGAGAIAVKVGTLAGGLIDNAGIITAASGIGIQVTTPGNGTIINTGLISGKTALSIGAGLVNVVNSGVLSGNIGGNSAIMTVSGASGSIEFGTISVDSLTFAPGAVQKLNGVTDNALVLNNQGALSAGSGGTVISAPRLSGPLTNAGQISVGGSGAAIVIGSVAGGSITNSGLITAMTAIRVGSGGLNLTNTGTIVGSIIDNDPTQGLTISGQNGTIVGDAISAASVTFASGVQFLAQDIIAGNGAGVVVNNATLALNSRQTITGSYIQNAAGMLQIGVGGVAASKYGELVVTGSASMANGRIALATVGNYRAPVGSVLTLVSAAASGSNFSGVTAVTLAGDYGFTTSTLLAGGIDELLATITSAPAVSTGVPGTISGGGRVAVVSAALAQIGNNPAVASGFQPVFNALNAVQATGGTAAYNRALKQLAPTQISANALAPSVLADLSRQVLSAIGIRTGQALAGADTPQGAVPSGAVTTGWVQVLGRATQRKADAGTDTDGYSASSYGVAAGVDTPIGTRGLAGMALSWGRANVNGKNDTAGNSTNIDSYQVSGYGRWLAGPVTVDGMVGYGYDQVGQNRQIAFLGDKATANYGATHVAVGATAGYSVPLDDDLILTPQVSLNYLHLDGDAYTESGAGVVNLAIAKSNANVTESGIGAKLTWVVDTDVGRMTPELKAAWVHDYGAGALATTAQMAGVSFATSVPRQDQNGVDLSAGLTLYDDNGVAFTLRYEGDIRSNYSSNSGNVNLQVPF